MLHTYMALNQRTLHYEGLYAEDGRFVTVTWDRWRKETRKFHDKDIVKDPEYWIRNSVNYPTEVTVWGADSFAAIESQLQVDQCLSCLTPLPVVVRPTPLGYGIRLNYPDGSVLRGHLTSIRTLTDLILMHHMSLAHPWQRETYVHDVPMPPYRVYSELFSSVYPPHKGEARLGEILFTLLVSSSQGVHADEDTEECRIEKLKSFCCAIVAPQLVQTFLQGYDFSSQTVQPYISALSPRPRDEALLQLVKAVLAQSVYEDWCGFAPGEEQIEELSHYLHNIMVQLMLPNAFESKE